MIHCLLLPPLFVGVLCLGLFCYAVFSVLFSLAIIMIMMKRELFTLIVSLRYYNCNCSVALPRGAVGWSAVCACGIS